jgi:hypothetical protein
MKQIDGIPPGIEIFSNVLSYSEADFIIDKIESAINDKNACDLEWGIPKMHSPDISCLRRDQAIAISEHSFLNSECVCGIREIDASLGKIMLKCLEKYVSKYDIGITQDEGFYCVKQGEDHVSYGVVDDNPFVNRIVSMHFALNVDGATQYIKFKNINFAATISSPSIILFPSNYLFSYEKPYNDGLYEIQNYFNNNPDQDFFEKIFGNDEVSVISEKPDPA